MSLILMSQILTWEGGRPSGVYTPTEVMQPSQGSSLHLTWLVQNTGKDKFIQDQDQIQDAKK